MTQKRRKVSRLAVVLIVLAVLIAAAIPIKIGFDSAYRQFMLASYPKNYENLVEHYSAENEVDPYLIYAVIKTESGFAEDAESNVGARGLMQIMSDTFDWIKYRLDDTSGITFDDMYSAESNLKYGAYLIGYLMRYYENNKNCAIAAYHAGNGSVDNWLLCSDYSDDGKTLKKIPGDDTAHYVNKVNAAYSQYLELYAGGKENG